LGLVRDVVRRGQLDISDVFPGNRPVFIRVTVDGRNRGISILHFLGDAPHSGGLGAFAADREARGKGGAVGTR
jgi:hypothetical protein